MICKRAQVHRAGSLSRCLVVIVIVWVLLSSVHILLLDLFLLAVPGAFKSFVWGQAVLFFLGGISLLLTSG